MSMDMNNPQSADGTLVIMVVRAKHLPNRRKMDKQSPYVVVRLSTIAKKTPSDFRAGQTPEWTHEIRFDLSREKKPVLKIDVLDETKNDPTPIGNCEIDASVIFANDHKQNGKYIHDKWYELTQNGRRAGMIYLEMTFYPSAPVLPPKIDNRNNVFMDLENISPSLQNEKSISPVFENRSEVFVSSNHASPFQESASDRSEVFVKIQPEVKGAKKYAAKFARFKSKLNEKKPLFWGNQNEIEHFSSIKRDISPISNYDYESDDEVPPVPPHQNTKPLPSPPTHRLESTAIPFSADSIGLEDDGPMPTKVFMLDQQVKSLAFDANKENVHHPISKDEIDPRYYAPTPSEHFNQTMRLQSGSATHDDLKIDTRTSETGYLGNGKFSPSVFQRIINEEDKPRVPPKVPQGLTEMEYYLLEKDKYLNDLQGKRT